MAPQSYCTPVASIQNFGWYLSGRLSLNGGMTILEAVILQTAIRIPVSSEVLEVFQHRPR